MKVTRLGLLAAIAGETNDFGSIPSTGLAAPSQAGFIWMKINRK